MLAATPLPQLEVSENGRYLVEEDGTPFYWQSDDGWAVNTRLDFDVTVPGTGKNEVDYYLDTRAAQGFTVIHTWLVPAWQTTNTEGEAPLVGSLNNGNPVVLNTPFFENVDQIVEAAESRGLYFTIELGQVLRTSPSNLWLGGFDAGNSTQDHAAHEAKAYEYGWKVADALRDRSNIIWGFGQDTVPTRADRVGSVNAANNGAKYVDLVRAMAEGVADATNATAGTTFNGSTFDAVANYDTTLMSFHVGATPSNGSPPVGFSSAEWFNNDEWLDFNINQGGRRERFYKQWYDLVADNYNLNPTKPIFEAEALYEGWGVPYDTLTDGGTPYDTRVSAYWSTFAGGFGTSYGNISTIYLQNDARYAPRGIPPVGGSVANWWEVIDSQGAQEIVQVKNLLASRPFLSRVPNQDLLSTGASVGYQRLVATSNSDGSYALIYSTNGRSFDVDLSEMSGATINAWWYSPRDGKVYDNGGSEITGPFETFSNTGGIKNFNPPGSANSSTASVGNDWVLVLDDASKGYATPGTVATIPGPDFDFDTDVDDVDLAIWETGFGMGTSQAQGDADLDGDVDGADFLAWQRGFTGNTQQQEEITLEGEAAAPSAGSSFTVGSDANASEGQYLFATVANRTTPDLSDYAELTYNITTAGTYRLLGSVLSPSSSQNSFWVQVDNGPIWKWHTPVDGTQYQDVYITDEGTGNPPVEVVLATGERKVRLYSRDPNTRLDMLELELVSSSSESLIAIEAENYSENTARNGNQQTLDTSPVGFSGEQVLSAAQNASGATLDVTNFGAVPNDGNDDLAAIQAAIAAASAGDTVFLPAGTFQISGRILTKSDIHLAGAGRDNTFVEYAGTSSVDSMILILGDRVQISDLTLDGLDQNKVRHGIVASDSLGHRIRNLRIQNIGKSSGFGSFGVFFVRNVIDSVIEDNEMNNLGTSNEFGGGVRVAEGSNRNQILRNSIINTGRGGIFVDQSTDAIIRGNLVRGSGMGPDQDGNPGSAPALGIEVFIGSDRAIVEDNDLDHWISIAGSDFTAVRRNNVVAPDSHIAYSGLELVKSSDTIFTDNQVGAGQYIGLSISGKQTERSLIARNRFSDQEIWGVQVTNTELMSQFFFSENIFETTDNSPQDLFPSTGGGEGFRFLPQAGGDGIRNIDFFNNSFINNDAAGIQIFNASGGLDRLTFVNNTIAGNGGNAFVGPLSFNNIEWTGNTVTNNAVNNQPTSTGFANNDRPEVQIIAPVTVSVGELVAFSINFTDDNDAQPTNVLWDFDEGIPVADLAPTYAFQNPGTFRVTLVAWDSGQRGAIAEQVITVVPATPSLPDFNSDGQVDGADLSIWETGFGTPTGASQAQGDADLDGDVDGADFLAWQRGLTPPAPAILQLEAEDATLFGNFAVGSDAAASGGQYIQVPNFSGNSTAAPDPNQKATFNFNVTVAGTYRIQGGVYVPNLESSSDSFWVDVDGGTPFIWDIFRNTSYENDYVSDRNGADPVEVLLSPGTRTVTVYLREDGARLDTLELELVASATSLSAPGVSDLQSSPDSNTVDDMTTTFRSAAVIAGLLANNGLSATSVDPFLQNGQNPISIEAENFSVNTHRNGNRWTLDASPTGFSGLRIMKSEGTGPSNINTGFATDSPQLDYLVNFTQTGTYFVWIRGNSLSSSAKNSVNVGLNGQAVDTSDRIDFDSNTSAWQWSNSTMDGPVASFEVTRLGVNTVNVWMREKGFLFDKIVLTADSELTISGAGPEESLGGPAVLSLTSVGIAPHRGGRAIYPENTLFAYSRNLSDGTSLDLDIRKTGDGDIVVIHDTTTNRTTESNLTVANSTVAQLQSLDAAYKFDPAGNSSFPLRGQGVIIPALDAVLAEFKANQQPGAFLWIDLKDDSDFTIAQNQALFDRLIELIGEHDLWDEARIEVASTAVGDELVARDPRVQVAFWNNQVSNVLAALNDPNFGTIGVPLSIADQVADAVHATGKKLHVTSGLFTPSILYDLKAAAPDSLGMDDYKTALDSLGISTAALGDTDNDGDIDGADFLAWQRGLGIAEYAMPVDGDADADGDVDLADLSLWQDNFSVVTSSTAAASVSLSVVGTAQAQNLEVQTAPPQAAVPLLSQQLTAVAVTDAWWLSPSPSATASTLLVSLGPLRQEGHQDSVAVAFDHFIPLVPSSRTGVLAKEYYLERDSTSSRVRILDSLPRFGLMPDLLHAEVVDQALDWIFEEGRATDGV